jgi:desulfoferrodoxin (superoxide reductase-like protein)
MAAIYETAYPRIKPHLNHKEFSEVFSPSPDELALLNAKTKKTLPVTRLGFMMILKCYQYLGRPVQVQKIDMHIKKYIAEKIGITSDIDLSQYNKKTRKRHIKIIRTYLEINTDKKERRKLMKSAALNAAATKENLADIINVVIEELLKFRFELSAFKRLLRLARAARTVVNKQQHVEIFNQLTDEQKKLIDIILGLVQSDDAEEKYFTWFALKQEPKKASRNNVKAFVNYVNQLKLLRQKININLNSILPARLEHLKEEAMVADLSEMKAMKSVKRYTLAAIFINMKAALAVDDLVQILITWIRKIEAQAKAKLEAYRQEQATQTDAFVLLLYNTLLAFKNNPTDTDKIQAIEKHLDGKTDEIIAACQSPHLDVKALPK